MGKEKRRAVVGKTYGPTRRKQITVWGIVVGVLVVLAILFLTVVSKVDNRDIPLQDTAPWTQPGASEEEPQPTDYLHNGTGGPDDPSSTVKPPAPGDGEVPEPTASPSSR